ncbi:hypothetical protein [Rugamonas rubra]|uniref:Uncharacterized protein n=1 Tax=Rugamonas rubra TaxID=758825 RepID=A0A1I4V5X0_9BURK|nr:hypothetical protein [Rugamonas rubra]SFM96561.1 hypothetical protein SAMN02982985_05925 [Rugamonas rubra]
MLEFLSAFLSKIDPQTIVAVLGSMAAIGVALTSKLGRRLAKDIANGVFIPSIEVVDSAKQMDAIQRKLEEIFRLAEDKSGLLPSSVSDKSEKPTEAGAEISGTDRLTRPVRVYMSEPSVSNLQATIDAVLISRTKNDVDMPIDQLWEMSRKVADEDTRRRQQSDLEASVNQQLGSAASIRRAMLNLFVLFNISLLIVLLFNVSQVLASKEVILGLYVSMATFIVYVYRSSNARVLILLAVKEDLKRYHDAQKYILRFGSKPPTEKDVDVLKLLLLNRVEREGNSEHPYELVLKGISNSNILFKGGKVATSGLKDKPSAPRKPSSAE